MKKIGLLTLLLLILTTLSFGQDKKKLEQLLLQAQQRKYEANNFLKLGEFAKAAESYTAAINPFLALTEPKEIAETEETVALLYSLRGMCYLGAKDNEKAVTDLQKKVDFYFNRAKNSFEKASVAAKPRESDSVRFYQMAISDAVQVLNTEANYYSAYNKIFRSMPTKRMIEDEKAKEIEKLFNQIAFNWGKLETAIFLRTNNAENARKALELLGDYIKQLPNEIDAYKLRESIYRKQGKIALANADKEKIKSLQK